jgi:hypothetical protein
MMVVGEDGVRRAFDDSFRLFVGTSQPDARSVALTGKAPVSIDLA